MNIRMNTLGIFCRCAIVIAVYCVAIPLNSANAADPGCATAGELSAGLCGSSCGCCSCSCLQALLCCETLCIAPPADQPMHQPYQAQEMYYYDHPFNMTHVQQRHATRYSIQYARPFHPYSNAFFEKIYADHVAAKHSTGPFTSQSTDNRNGRALQKHSFAGEKK